MERTGDGSAADDAFEALMREAARVSLPAQPGAWLAIGSTLAEGRLQVLRRIGQGGMGVVYEVFDAERRERVALKLLSRLSPESVYRLKNEFRSLVELAHANLIRLHELFAEDGRWYYTMELVRGTTFDRYVRPDGVLAEARLRESISQLIAAIRAIHRAGKLHRDLKPSNVLVREDGSLVVLDFGLSIDAEHGGVGQTRSEDAICGTPAYMAPEQAAGRAPSPESDLYALGVMLFEALTGRLPFAGGAGEIIAAKLRDPAPLPSDHAQAVPPDLDRLCSVLLARDPAERRRELDAFREGAEARAPDPGGRRAAASTLAPEQASAHERRGPRLYGRAEELALLRAAYRDLQEGRPTVLSISGTSGVGKSALCEAFVQELHTADDVTVLKGRCYERESVPFKVFDPLVDAATRFLRRLPADQARALLPGDAAALVRLFPVLARVPAFATAPALEHDDARELQRRAFAAFGALLARFAVRGPLVLFLDDLQWADADSLVFLQQLLTQPHRLPALWLLSERAEHSARGEPTKLARVLAVAREDPDVTIRRLELGPLSPAATGELVRELLGGELGAHADLVDAIVRGSEGSPFLAAEIARFAKRGGGHFRAPSLAEALTAMVAGLPPAAVRLLELLALAGEPLLLRVALEAAAATHADVERLRAEHLLRIGASSQAHGSGKTAECYHDRVRETVAAGLSEAAKRDHAKRLSEVWAGLDDVSADFMCRCLFDAGERAAAARLALTAAERAASALAFDRAAELYARALAWSEPAQDERVALLETCGRMLENAGRGREAAEHYRAAAEHTTGLPSLELAQRAADQLLVTGHFSEGIGLLERLCEQVGVVFPRSTAGSVARLAWVRARLPWQPFAERAAQPPATALRLEVASTLVKSFLSYGPSIHAYRAAADYLLSALREGDGRHATQALGFAAQLHALRSGSATRARLLADRLSAAAHEHPLPLLVGFSSFTQGVIAQLGHDLESARSHLARALESYRETPGLHGALDGLHFYHQLNAFSLGEFADIVRETPPAINEAFRRGRVWLGAALTGTAGMPAWLTPDDPLAARDRIDEARRRWQRLAEPQFPDYQLLSAEMMLSIYEGRPERGLELLRAHLPGHESLPRGTRALEPHMGVIIYRGLCAASALQAAPRHARGRAELRETLRQTQRLLRRTRWGYLAPLLEIALAVDRNDRDLAVTAFQRLVALTPPSRGGVHVAVGQLRFGPLLGGEEGRALVAQGLESMRAQGVKNPDALAETLCPGCRI